MPGEDDRNRDYYGERPPPTIDPTKLTNDLVEKSERYLKELFQAEFKGKDELYTEKFKRLTIQILERDTLREAAKIDANERIAAALQAAKEAVGKTEANFSEQLKSINSTMGTMADGLRREMGDLKDRVLTSEGQSRGRTDNSTQLISWIIAAAAVAGLVVTVVMHH